MHQEMSSGVEKHSLPDSPIASRGRLGGGATVVLPAGEAPTPIATTASAASALIASVMCISDERRWGEVKQGVEGCLESWGLAGQGDVVERKEGLPLIHLPLYP